MTTGIIGRPLARVDGRAKVTGRARYAADFNQPVYTSLSLSLTGERDG